MEGKQFPKPGASCICCMGAQVPTHSAHQSQRRTSLPSKASLHQGLLALSLLATGREGMERNMQTAIILGIVEAMIVMNPPLAAEIVRIHAMNYRYIVCAIFD